MRSSFVRKGTVASAPDPGTRPGLYGQTLVSSGHGDLDQLLGGGLPLGSLTLVLEDGWSGHHATLLRYFLAEGAACGQSLLLAAAEPPEGGLAGFVPQQLPGRPEREEEEEERRRAAAGSEQVELRIAWQYRRYMKGASQGPQAQQDQQRQRRDGVAGAAGMGPAAVQPRQGQAGRQPARPRGAAAGLRGWCHKFDLTRGTGEEGLQACHARLAQCSGRDALAQLAGATSAFLQQLQPPPSTPAGGTAAVTAPARPAQAPAPPALPARAPSAPPAAAARGPQGVGRLAVLSLGSLGWRPAAGAAAPLPQPAAAPEPQAAAVLQALLLLKAAVRGARCAAVVSIPAALFTPSDVVRMQHLADGAVALESVADDADIVRLAPDSASVAGLLHLRKLPALGTAAPPAPDVALHLLRHRRRRLSISPVEVDPDAEAAAAEGVLPATAAGLACARAGGGGASALDF